ncbi:MAG: repeat-like domain, partial [Planctomycetaceae bacterium]|nr:repeat-like domain [Planctomycetaceae bacterium]
EQLEQPAAAFDTWARVRLGNIIYQTAYATTEPARLKELASKLAQDTLQPYQVFILKNLDRELSKQRKVAEFLKSGPANPFKASPLPGFEFARSGPAAASLAKLRDGRMVMAYTTGDHHQTRIQLSLSRDGITWEVPWEFAHNSVFNTRAPSVVVDDHGEIWMLCLSQRLTTQRFASWPYQLWLTHSRDGHEWSPLRVLQMKSESARIEIATSQYQEVPQLMRLPGNRFGIIWRDQFAAAKSPGEISVLNTLPLPRTNNKPLVSNTHATFESGGRCHLVFDDFGRGLYYTRSEDLQIWTPLQFQGAAGTNSSISMPQLLLEGDHAVLLHEENNGVWLQRGAVSPEGLKLGTKIQIADHLMPLNGSRLYLDGDRVLIPAGGHDYLPNLLTASFAELLVP